jgi:hypothetical protein
MKSYGTDITSITKINGTQVTSGSAHISSTYTSWHTWINEAWGYLTIQKGATAKTITIAGSFAVTNNGSSLGSGSGSTTVTVPALANGSDFTIPTSVAAGSTLNIAINRTVATYTHKVTITFGSQTDTASDVETSLAYTIPLAWLTQIPAAVSGAASVSVETFNGTTKIGSTITKAIAITAPATAVPTISTLTIAQIYDLLSPAVPSTWEKYIQNRSGAQVSAGGVAGYQGSTITSIVISGGGYSANASVLDTGVLRTAGTITFTATATDSRGRTATKTASITVAEYAPPKIPAALTQRANSSGSLDSSGTYALGTVSYSYSSVDGANNVTRALWFRQTGTENWTEAGSFSSGVAVLFGGSFDVTKSYDVLYIITDAFGSIQYADSISTAMPILEVGMGGLALAIGKEPEQAGLDVGWVARFRKAVQFDVAPSFLSTTEAAAFRGSIGLGNTTGPTPIANGGTGQITAALARNALGLGNTTGPVPIPNGGTGATTVAAALTALGLTDSGWIYLINQADCKVCYRSKGGTVTVIGGNWAVAAYVLPAATYKNLATLPAAYRPTAFAHGPDPNNGNGVPFVGSSLGQNSVFGYIAMNGNIALYCPVAASYWTFSVSYPV